MAREIRLANATVGFFADVNRFVGNLQKANQAVKSQQAVLRRFRSDLRKLGRELDRSVTRVGNFAKQLGALAIGFGTGGLINQFRRFDDALVRQRTLIGLSSETVRGFRSEILRLGPELGRSPADLAEGLFFLTSAGLRGQTALDALTASTKAASIGLGTTLTVAEGLTSALGAWGLEALEVEQATSILLATVREGRFAPELLAREIGRLGSVAAELGVSFDEVGAGLAFLSRSRTLTQASTGLLGIFINLLKPAEQAKNELEKVGLTVDELRARIADEGLLQTLINLRAEFEQSGADIAKLFERVDGLQALFALTGPTVDQARAVFSALARDASTGAAELDRAFRELSESPGFRLDVAYASLNLVMLSFAQQVVPTVVKAITALVQNLDRVIHVFQLLVVFFISRSWVGTLLVSLARVTTGLLRVNQNVRILGVSLQKSQSQLRTFGLFFTSFFDTRVPVAFIRAQEELAKFRASLAATRTALTTLSGVTKIAAGVIAGPLVVSLTVARNAFLLLAGAIRLVGRILVPLAVFEGIVILLRLIGNLAQETGGLLKREFADAAVVIGVDFVASLLAELADFPRKALVVFELLFDTLNNVVIEVGALLGRGLVNAITDTLVSGLRRLADTLRALAPVSGLISDSLVEDLDSVLDSFDARKERIGRSLGDIFDEAYDQALDSNFLFDAIPGIDVSALRDSLRDSTLSTLGYDQEETEKALAAGEAAWEKTITAVLDQLNVLRDADPLTPDLVNLESVQQQFLKAQAQINSDAETAVARTNRFVEESVSSVERFFIQLEDLSGRTLNTEVLDVFVEEARGKYSSQLDAAKELSRVTIAEIRRVFGDGADESIREYQQRVARVLAATEAPLAIVEARLQENLLRNQLAFSGSGIENIAEGQRQALELYRQAAELQEGIERRAATRVNAAREDLLDNTREGILEIDSVAASVTQRVESQYARLAELGGIDIGFEGLDQFADTALETFDNSADAVRALGDLVLNNLVPQLGEGTEQLRQLRQEWELISAIDTGNNERDTRRLQDGLLDLLGEVVNGQEEAARAVERTNSFITNAAQNVESLYNRLVEVGGIDIGFAGLDRFVDLDQDFASSADAIRALGDLAINELVPQLGSAADQAEREWARIRGISTGNDERDARRIQEGLNNLIQETIDIQQRATQAAEENARAVRSFAEGTAGSIRDLYSSIAENSGRAFDDAAIIEYGLTASQQFTNVGSAALALGDIISRDLVAQFGSGADNIIAEWQEFLNNFQGSSEQLAEATAKFWNERLGEINSGYKEIVDLNRQTVENISRGFGNFAADVIRDFSDIGDAARRLGETIVNELINRLVTQPITNAVSGALGGLLKGFGIPGFQAGGLGRGLGLVGERGPEIIDFSNPYRVYTNEQLGSALSSGGGQPVVNLSVNVTSDNPEFVQQAIADSVPALRDVIRSDLAQELSRPSELNRVVRRY